MAKFNATYKRCRKCEDASACTSMCVDVCWDEVMRLEARKELKKEIDIYQYEMERTKYIMFKSDWARMQKKKRGY